MTKEEAVALLKQVHIYTARRAGKASIAEALGLAISALEEQTERKCGRWIFDIAYYDDDGCPCIVLRCSECGEAHPKSNYCPNCGADMRKGEVECLETR